MWRIEQDELEKLGGKYKFLKIWGDITMGIALIETIVAIGSAAYVLIFII